MSTSLQPQRIILPDEVSLLKLIKSRSEEINAINIECKTKMPKLSQQRLPRYMRRRAASHNPKRVPKMCRSKWLTSTAPGHDKVSIAKEKKRKAMKKHPSEEKIKSSIARRQAKPDRSVLHLWFVRRFKLNELWSKKVPIRNNMKNQRNLYRVAKAGACFYYMTPLMRVFQINYGQKVEELKDALRKLTNRDVSDDIEVKVATEQKHMIYEVDAYPFKVIGPAYLTWLEESHSLLVWTEAAAFEQIQKAFSAALGQLNFDLTLSNLERIRLVGPKLGTSLERAFGGDYSNLIDTPHKSLLTVSGSEQTSSASKFDFDSSEPNQCVLVNTSLRDRFSFDLILTRGAAKAVWNKLTTNKSHLVGGLRDLKNLHFDASSVLYPFVGFADREQSLKWTSLFDGNAYFIVRSVALLKQLSNMSEVAKVSSKLNNSLASVVVKFVSRGTPEADDIICAATAEDFVNLEIANRDPIAAPYAFNEPGLNMIKLDADVKQFSRKAIGFLEHGGYCLDSGCGKALGAIRTEAYCQIVAINQKCLGPDISCVLALCLSRKSALYRFVEITLITD